MQHLNAKNTTLYCEDGAEFDRLLESLRAEHSPVGSTEDFLVQQMTASFWKARRLGRVEIGMIDYQTDDAVRFLKDDDDEEDDEEDDSEDDEQDDDEENDDRR